MDGRSPGSQSDSAMGKDIGQVTGCQANWEVGDPLSGTLMPPITMNGKSYQMQELAFYSWFFNKTGDASVGAVMASSLPTEPSKLPLWRVRAMNAKTIKVVSVSRTPLRSSPTSTGSSITGTRCRSNGWIRRNLCAESRTHRGIPCIQ